MDRRSEFLIQNDLLKVLSIFIEPEGAVVPLEMGEELLVQETFRNAPLTLKFSSEDGEPLLSIWPGDGNLMVTKDGIDVLDPIPEAHQPH